MQRFITSCLMVVGLLVDTTGKALGNDPNGTPLPQSRLAWATQNWQGGMAAVLSPDNRRLLISSGNQGAILYQVPEMKILRVFPCGRVNHLAFSPDSSAVFTGHSSGRVTMWDTKLGEPLRVFQNGESLRGFAVTDDGKRLTIALREGTVTTWDITTGRRVGSFKSHGTLRSLSADKASSLILVTPFSSSKIWLHDSRGEVKHEFALDGRPHFASLSDTGDRVVVGTRSEEVVVWNAATGTSVQKFSVAGDKRVFSMKVSPDGKWLYVARKGFNEIEMWNVDQGRLERKLGPEPGSLSNISDDSRYIITGSYGAKHVWETTTGRLAYTIRVSSEKPKRVVADTAGHALLMQDRSGLMVLWDLKAGKPRRLGRATGNAIAVSGDGSTAVAPLTPTQWRIWKIREKESFLDLQWKASSLTAVGLGMHGRILVTGHENGAVLQWNTETSKMTRQFPQQPMKITALAVSPRGDRLLTGYGGANHSSVVHARLWNLTDGAQLQEISHRKAVLSAHFSSDGGRVLTSGGKEALVHDVATHQRIGRISVSPNVYPYENAWLSADGCSVMIYPYTKAQFYSATGRSAFKNSIYLGQTAKPTYRGGSAFWRTTGNGLAAYRVGTGELLLTLMSLNDGNDWLAFTPDGRYDGSENGRRQVAFAMNGPPEPKIATDPALRQRLETAQAKARESKYTPGLLTNSSPISLR